MRTATLSAFLILLAVVLTFSILQPNRSWIFYAFSWMIVGYLGGLFVLSVFMNMYESRLEEKRSVIGNQYAIIKHQADRIAELMNRRTHETIQEEGTSTSD